MPKKRVSRGRPTKLAAKVVDPICNQLEMAVPEKFAARSFGISESTFHEWMQKGKAGIKPYVAFYKAVDRASARAVGNLHVRSLTGGPGSSQATWLLARRYPGEYGSQRTTGDAAEDAPIDIERERKTAEAILTDPAAVKKLHEAIAMTVAADAKRKGQPKKKP